MTFKNGIFSKWPSREKGAVCDGQMESCELVRLIILAVFTQMHTRSLPHFSSCLPFHGLSSIWNKTPSSPPPWPSAAAVWLDASHSPEDQSFKEQAAGDTLSPRFLKCASQVTLKCYFFFKKMEEVKSKPSVGFIKFCNPKSMQEESYCGVRWLYR